jgi:biotin-dependent carboxylase-like uncharacterized protein
MTALRVTSPGGASTIQDYGRPGYQRYGVPEAGAMDRLALGIANRLVGNEEDEACIEVAMLGGAYEAVDGGCRMAVAGGAFDVAVDGVPYPPYASFDVSAGGQVTIGRARAGTFGYLAVAGGFDIPAVLGSRSTHARSGIGGGVLTPGTLLPLRHAGGGVGPRRGLHRTLWPRADGPLRVMMGPQDDFFSNEAKTAFLKGPYRIGLQSDRMGYRLEGPTIAHVAGFNIVSDGIAPGSIQVPGSGQPIVLLADRQSTGGYPKIATLLSVDIRRLVQRRPDEPITFVAVTPAEVDAILREDRAATAALLAAILPVSDGDLYDSGRLLGLNLIDGFIAGEA